MFKFHVTYVKWGRVYNGLVLANDYDSACHLAEKKYGKATNPMVCST